MKNNFKTIFILIVTCVAVVTFMTVLQRAVFYSPTEEIHIPASQVEAIKTVTQPLSPNSPYPKELRIPSLDIDAKVQYVGITAAGKMATPNNFTDVGWFKYGALPGDMGSAVIAGHVDNGLAFPGVFANLHTIKDGDDVYIDAVDGTTFHFKVTGMKTYPFDAPPDETAQVFDQHDNRYIKLITCTGVWQPALRTHDKRLVVTAVQVNS